MDSDIEELESLFSEHFGRTPLNTPAGSQEIDDINLDDGTEEDETIQLDLIQSVVDGRTRCLVESQERDVSVTYREEGRANSSGTYCVEAPEENEQSDDSNGNEIVELSDNESNDDFNRIGRFLQAGCGCKKEKCITDLRTNTIYQHILNVREMKKEEKDMYLISSMLHGDRQEHTKRGKKRKRSRIGYLFNGVSVCRPAFMLLFDIGKHSLAALVSHVKKGNIAPRMHGNSGRTASHALKYDDVKRVVEFIQNYAETYGLPQPAAPRGRDSIPPIYLGSETLKYKVHLDYVTSCNHVQVHFI